MSPLFQKTEREKYTPTEIKFSKLYQKNVGNKKALGDSVLISAKNALRQAGYTDNQIAKIITHDKPIPVRKMRQVAETMNQAQLFGFEKEPKWMIKTFLNKERVKAQSIARITKEHILEMSEDELGKVGVTTLSQKSQSPNAPKPGESSILDRSKGSQSAQSSLSGRKSSKPLSSFGGRTAASTGSLTRPISKGNGIGISIKPRF
jgi:hypothetical protein